MGADGDPLDIIIYSGVPLVTGCVVSGRVIGALDMEDKDQKDYKILIVPSFNSHKIKKLEDLEENYLDIIRDFFSYYKNVTKSKVKINGWLGAEETLQIIENSIV
jgi:inorganic pyrophosphatase